VLASVRRGLDSGAYDLDTTFLLQDLKGDFALLTFCLKELLKHGTSARIPLAVLGDPIALLRWGGVQRVRTVLNSEKHPPRTHTLGATDALLGERLRHTAITATTAELLSERAGVGGEGAFCHGIMRQIGLNLIAWNYPTLYARVLGALSARSSLDDELSKELGFSPAMLAMRVMRPSIDTSPTAEHVRTTWSAYDQLCEIGEALARASSPELYPSAQHDWNKAGDFIRGSIGLDGLDLVCRRAVENTVQYKKALPGTFEALARLDPESAISTFMRSVRSRQNPYVDRCPIPTRSRLVSLYGEMPAGEVNRAAVERLVKQIIPAAGFIGGCVFVVDPAAMSLIPRTLIGKVSLRRLAPVVLRVAPGAAMAALITEHISSARRPLMDLAAAAFDCEQPLIERDETGRNSSIAGIYSCLGKKRKIGVLYLELPSADLAGADQTALTTFKALRQALCDALLVE
jgi:hypothetical protein